MAAPEIIPNPDPSAVTSQAIDRAIGNAEKIINARIDGIEKGIEVFQADLTRVPTSVDRAVQGLRELLEMRLNGVDHDMAGIHSYMDKRREDIQEQISHLRDLLLSETEKLSAVTTERFLGVAAQFSERDTRTDQRAGDTKLAVDAAFAAAKEATSKIEMGFTKSIDGQQDLMNTNTKATDDKISDLKDRVTAMESRTQGIGAANVESRNNQNDSRGMMFGIVGIAIGIAAILVEILTRVIR
jgi:hypothetical protein